MKEHKNNWLAFSSIGFQLVASLLMFGWIGNLIDYYFLSSPNGLVIGLIFGGLVSLYQIWIIASKK
tara:strand:+ start:28541 stop:28738 length:198 start_codon:yes stop_codon:yes gene_type:complete